MAARRQSLKRRSTMPWVMICLVVALVLSILYTFLAWWTMPAPRPIPHLGWLAFAFFIAAFMMLRGAERG
jgi:hypothetical protein